MKQIQVGDEFYQHIGGNLILYRCRRVTKTLAFLSEVRDNDTLRKSILTYNREMVDGRPESRSNYVKLRASSATIRNEWNISVLQRRIVSELNREDRALSEDQCKEILRILEH